MTFQITNFKISGADLSLSLNAFFSEEKWRTIYIEGKTGRAAFSSFKKQIKEPELARKGYRPLSYRDIVLYCFKAQHSKAIQTKVFALPLKQMTMRKKEKEKASLLCLVMRLYDCIKNYFAGFGFCSTESLALSLLKEEDQKVPRSFPETTPFNLKKPKVSENQQIREKRSTLKHMSTRGKNTAMGNYVRDPKNCSSFSKNIIYSDIKSIEPENGREDKDAISVVGLMELVSSSEKVDLCDPMCAQVLLDVFSFCNKETSEQLSEWLKTEGTFHPSLLKDCLLTFKKLSEKQKPYSLFALQNLIQIYIKNQWSEGKDLKGAPLLPSNDPVVISAMSLLIENAPNDKLTCKWAEWFIEQKDFDKKSFAKWIRIFTEKEATLGKGRSLYYPLKNTLLKALSCHEEWKKDFASLT